ncbi:MAG: zf-TFIIB domain-containing protein [marine benthic group bacterium]|jgi:Zn-finger nucleic acid-binding protein|nr:zf-TFIIB domain-containing protein [Gemmatimonadota bacterium]MCL7962793.1 zf-TFIIB domain-containing protein [Candidatus Carthagonibacter metallireducens]MCL7957780.1 zf-TFIIB domain-containing protein [Gemmatimonadota bacterium]MCL7964849.1 zf-TFIIB domain-containing protein [Gemmatimonadota bacterium]MCL7968621.1 zf-TFIIB domain-containing protein [Gemmatimonadota bacterium]
MSRGRRAVEWRTYKRTGRVYAGRFNEDVVIATDTGPVEAAAGDYLVVDSGLRQVRHYTAGEFAECFASSDRPVPIKALPELSAVVASRVTRVSASEVGEECSRCHRRTALRDFEGSQVCADCELAIKAGREERIRCLHDDSSMRKELIEGVIVDRCPSCGGVWFDGGELEALSSILQRAADQGMPSPVASRLFHSLTQRLAE